MRSIQVCYKMLLSRWYLIWISICHSTHAKSFKRSFNVIEGHEVTSSVTTHSHLSSESKRRYKKRLYTSVCLQTRILVLSGNTPFSHTSLHPIQTKLGQSDQYLDHYSGSNDDGVRGHDGVTGVKKVIFTKKASSPTECVALTRDLCIWISLTPSTKVITLKIHLGSLGVTGVKRSFSPKRHQVLQDT